MSEFKDFISSAMITSANHDSELDVKYRTDIGEALAYIMGGGYVPHSKYFNASASVSDNNVLDVKYRTDVGELLENFINSVRVPSRVSLVSRGYVEPAHVDFRGSGYSPHSEYFKSLARINENLELDVRMGIMQPPVETVAVSCVKDAYTRQYRPTINYGTSQSLMVGRAADGEYISYIEFDLSPIANLLEMNLVSIDLAIGKVDSTDGELKFYECFSSWSERYLIWLNQLDVSSVPFHSATYTSGMIRFDIKDLIMSYINQGRTRFGFAVKSKDLVILKARESGTPPQLVVNYTDPDWNGFLENLHLTNRAVIRKLANRDIASVYRLVSQLFVPANARIRNGQFFESRAYVNNPALFNKAEPVVSSRFPSNATIKATGYSDLDSSYATTELFQGGKGDVPYRKDMYGSAEILPEFEQFDFNVNADLIRTYVLSFVEAVRSTYLPNSAVIRRIDESSLDSMADIMNAVLNGSSSLAISSHINSSALVKRINEPNYFESKVYMEKPYILGKSGIGYSKGIIGNAIIRTPYGHDTLANAISIRNSLKAYAMPNYSVYFVSSASVRVNGSKDLQSVFTVPEPAILNSNSIVRVATEYDLLGRVVSRRSTYDDVESYVEVPYRSDIGGSSTVFRCINLYGNAVIRQLDVYNLRSEASVRGGFYHEHWNASATIALKSSYMFSYAEIHSDARIWRPNVEGGLDFEDRKLPRIWVRSNFIVD